MVLLIVTQPAAGPSCGLLHVQSTEHKAGFLPERLRGRRAQPWTESCEAEEGCLTLLSNRSSESELHALGNRWTLLFWGGLRNAEPLSHV